jgi:arginine utilization regulatory protein
MHNLIASAKKAAEADCSVLVYGETGTGKELLVQGIHNYSNRSSELFVAINCAAIPETLLESMLFGTVKGAFTGAVDSPGLFEQAGKGTLFLDELNSMSPPLQAKLLRVLQERRVRRLGGSAEIPVGCRIVSSTNVDPWECIRKGQLRKDLFYRLAVISLYIPSLKERVEDIEVLLNHFLNKYQKIYGLGKVKISPELRNVLQNYQWPGNVRELEHVIESAVNMLDGEQVITVDHLPLYLKTKLLSQGSAAKALPKGTLAEVLTQVEKQVILDALEKHNWNITKAADSLGIVRQNLQYRIRKLGINS